MFIDEVKIHVHAGNGGAGCMSFRREAHVPKGGPDGGDGGDGGSVFLQATEGVDTLLDMTGRHHWRAQPGEPGFGKKKAGADGPADGVKAALRRAFALPESVGLTLGNGADELIRLLRRKRCARKHRGARHTLDYIPRG